MQATSTINHSSAQYLGYEKETTHTIGPLQNAILSELPGAVFAALTLIWIVSSLIRL